MSIHVSGALLAMLLTMTAANAAYLSPGPAPSPTPSPGAPQASDPALPTMNYWGGPVVENAKVYAVFWGPSVAVETQERIGGFFRSLGDSSYFDFMNDEYNTDFFDVNGHFGTFQDIHHARYMGATTIFPKNTSTMLDDSASKYEIAAEINYQISIGVLPPYDRNTIYQIFLPPGVGMTAEYGTSCQQWCGMNGAVPGAHGQYLNYGVMPDQSEAAGCGLCSGYYAQGNAFDTLTYITSWSLSACVTDPEVAPAGTPSGGVYPESWIANDGETEIGTMCDYSFQTATLKGTFGNYLVQPLWSRSNGACTTTDFVSR